MFRQGHKILKIWLIGLLLAGCGLAVAPSPIAMELLVTLAGWSEQATQQALLPGGGQEDTEGAAGTGRPAGEVQAEAQPPEEQAEAQEEAQQPEEEGAQLFAEYCAACHQGDGQGIEGAYPPLAGNPFVATEDPQPVIQVVLTGRGGMPRFQEILSNEEIAAILSYVRTSWNNNATPVNVTQVEEVYQSVVSPADH
jgi:mono/diheme cytochrome c family protein